MAEGPQPPFGGDRARLIQDVSKALAATRDYHSAVQAVVRGTVPALADLVVVALQNGSDERLEVAHADPSREAETAEWLRAALPHIRRVAEKEWRSGRQFRWVPQISRASFRSLTAEPSLGELVGRLGIRSLIVVPLRSGGRILGGMGFAQLSEDRRFHAADLAVAQLISRRAATALESAEFHDQGLDDEARRTRLEDALQKWIKVFDLAGWGAAIVDGTDYRIEAVNPAFARIHQSSPDILIGRLFTDLLPRDRVGEQDRWRADTEHHMSAYESEHLSTDGRQFPVLTNVTALETSPEATSYVVTIQDLTEIKRTEERLHQAQRMEAVGRLAGGVAHEVNNMMTVILGFSDLLGKAAELSEERQREIEEIRKAATRAGKITQQLLAFSRQQILQPSDLQLNEVITELSGVLRLLLPANIRIETVLSPVSSTLHVDRAQLDQMLINLAFNARDAMPAGGTLKLTTESRWLNEPDGRRHIGIPIPAGQYALISVRDSGHGMDQTTIAHVFEPFFTTKPLGTGTGLGLATVYGIVKQSGGYVWIESTPGGGTTVTVSLPEVYHPTPAAAEQQPSARIEGCRIGGTVLVIEDEETVRELACRVLEEEGFRVLQASHAAGVIEILEDFGDQIDLVLSDVIISDMAPADLERRVHEHGRKLPIFYMSGYSREEVVERGLIPEGHRFLQKPFTPEELTTVVSRELEAAAATGGRQVTT